MKRTLGLAVALIVFSLFAAVFSPLIAAQGTITEVNPSGVHGTVVVLQADEGEEVVKDDVISFVRPRAFQAGYVPEVGEKVIFDAVRNGKHVTAVNVTPAPEECFRVGSCSNTGEQTSSGKPVTGSEPISWGAIKQSLK